MTKRRWGIRCSNSGWWLTFGLHIDPSHPMLTLFLSRLQLNIGRFYVVSEVDGKPVLGGSFWCWTNPEER